MGRGFRFFIKEEGGKYAIFHENEKRISDWWDYVYEDGLVKGESCYYVVNCGGRLLKLFGGFIVRGGKEAIFDVEKGRISEWWNKVEPFGLVKGKSSYYVVMLKGKGGQKKRAIFDVKGNQVSGWHDRIYFIGLIDGRSTYYVVERDEDFKKAIFNVNGERVSDWWDEIGFMGLVSGESEYYVVTDKRRGSAIFHVEKGRVSEWWEAVHVCGLVDGSSKMFYVVMQGGKLGLVMLGERKPLKWLENSLPNLDLLLKIVRETGEIELKRVKVKKKKEIELKF